MTNSHPIDQSDIPDLNSNNSNSIPQRATDTVQTTVRTTKNEHLQRQRTINKKQSQLFHFVKSWAERKEHYSADPFYIFLTGGAGTGKSHTIKISSMKLTVHYQDKVKMQTLRLYYF